LHSELQLEIYIYIRIVKRKSAHFFIPNCQEVSGGCRDPFQSPIFINVPSQYLEGWLCWPIAVMIRLVRYFHGPIRIRY
jgi:hypothetical protein